MKYNFLDIGHKQYFEALPGDDKELLGEQGWWVSGLSDTGCRCAFIKVADEVYFLGGFETYLNALNAIDAAKSMVKLLARHFLQNGPSINYTGMECNPFGDKYKVKD